MEDKDDVLGCLAAFIKSALKLFVPVSMTMILVIGISLFVEEITNSSVLGIFALVIIPVVIAIRFFSRLGGRE